MVDRTQVDTVDEAVLLAYRQVPWFLDIKVGVVEREGNETLCWVRWACREAHNWY